MSETLRKLTIAGIAALLVTVGAVGGHLLDIDSQAHSDAMMPDGAGNAMPIRSDGSSILADVAERVGPGVVFIRTTSQPGSAQRGNSPFEFFRDYFDQQRGERDDDNSQRERFRPEGGGSGFVIDAEGRILTNHHVIRGANKITVLLMDQEYEATLVGADPLTDIAVIQIDPPAGMTVVPFGDSDGLRVGEWVMAIGTPFGTLQGSVTAGIVSALGRNDLQIMGGEAIYQNYIQTDASINFGNSGGPLVNLKGEAIGINTAINPSGQGIGFAIPINMVRRVTAQLIESGKVAYGFMGINLQELNRDLAEGRGLKVNSGILVTDVVQKSPAADAGLQAGDVIVEFNKSAVVDDNDFRMRVANTAPGTEVPMEVVRDGKKMKLSIRIGHREEMTAMMGGEASEIENAWLGIHADDATKTEYRRRYGFEREQGGVVVLGVDPGSPADAAGLREGDVITEVYTNEVSNLGDFMEVAEKLKERKAPIAFLVKRGRSTQFLTVNPAER